MRRNRRQSGRGTGTNRPGEIKRNKEVGGGGCRCVTIHQHGERSRTGDAQVNLFVVSSTVLRCRWGVEMFFFFRGGGVAYTIVVKRSARLL